MFSRLKIASGEVAERGHPAKLALVILEDRTFPVVDIPVLHHKMSAVRSHLDGERVGPVWIMLDGMERAKPELVGKDGLGHVQKKIFLPADENEL